MPIVVFNPLNIAREDIGGSECGFPGWHAKACA